MGIKNRGALIVFEGCDRVGKTTQCKMLVEALRESGHKAEFMNFPDRTTTYGALINKYLTNQSNYTNEEIHLLFTLNRWEKKTIMESKLRDGVSLVVDRYSYSGVAYSVAKGLEMAWCKGPEAGLLKPDMVAFLTLTPEAMSKRQGFGVERLETPKLQKAASAAFGELFDNEYWTNFDADCSMEQLNKQLFDASIVAIAKAESKDFGTLW